MGIYFRVSLIEIESGRGKPSSHIMEEAEMYKLLQRWGAKGAGLLQLKVSRLTVEETEAFLRGDL